MPDGAARSRRDALAQARETIARQALEIERLQHGGAAELRDALHLAGLAGTIAAPAAHARLLETIVETAAEVIGARAGALFLIDNEREALSFEVAIGPRAREARQFRVPLGHGIAGLVAVSGQAMAVSDVPRDARHAVELAQQIDYLPETIVCVPLVHDEEIIGVLELLDKHDHATFSPADIHLLGLFANQAAVAIQQSRTRSSLVALIRAALPVSASPDAAQQLQQRAGAFAAQLEDEPAYRRAAELAQLVHEIARHGPQETQACETILRGFAAYLGSQGDAPGGPQAYGQL